ncbi:MAG: HDOD domain-containing protein [Phycisphaeraceae bacterium]|nr:HDOD domain-containing protein [Phycisphaeraceae bacterium]
MTAASTADQTALVDSAIRGISHIATLPEITLRIIELVEDPSSTAQDLHGVIENDLALCSRILKVVNSAFYGLPRQIGSINRAIVLLGLNAVKNIAIAASLTKLFRGGELCPGFSARDLWTHSIATGAASKLIADQLRLGLPDEAFLAGLIHDIGIMVEMQAKRDGLIRVIGELRLGADGTPAHDMRELETRLIGANHCHFGAALCETWKFPKSFGYVTRYHHQPGELPEANRVLANVVNIADRMAARAGLGFRADLPTLDFDPLTLREVGLTQESADALGARLPDAYREVEATFTG